MSSESPVRPDDTPPQNGTILVSAVLTVVTLVALKFGFDSYLEGARRIVRTHNLAENSATMTLEEYREASRHALETGRTMSIDDAIAALSQRARGEHAQIRPTPSNDTGAREGWNRLSGSLTVSVETPEPEVFAAVNGSSVSAPSEPSETPTPAPADPAVP